MQENRRLNRRVAELTDLVAELVVPLARREDAGGRRGAGALPLGHLASAVVGHLDPPVRPPARVTAAWIASATRSGSKARAAFRGCR